VRKTVGRFSAVCLFAVMSVVPAFAGEVPPVALQMIEQANEQLAATGSNLRIVSAHFFTTGQGVESYRRLRTGTRWTFENVSYVIDGSDMTTDVPAAQSIAAIQNGYASWNAIANTDITTNQVADDGTNFDVIDGTYHPVTGNCVSLFDVTSPNLDLGAGLIFPEADIVVGGWLPAKYFSSCLGSSSIIGVTWTFADGDSNADQYTDTLYVEQFYNEGFQWVTSGATFLGPTMDVESIVVHENGHALGLDHMGGPNTNEPFKLQPNGKVFDPEAVMNPFYIGGEKRTPFPTDKAALRTLYTGHP
jgi:hypothetical protein